MKEIECCPWCPMGGDVSLACTDVGARDEYQVWCRKCWAHGPSKMSDDRAIDAWNGTSFSAEEKRKKARRKK